jgi:hypothetical protein
MVQLRHDCDCKTCSGGESPPAGQYGGWKCTCQCHSKQRLEPTLWCAYCGKHGNHQSGWCPEIKKVKASATAEESSEERFERWFNLEGDTVKSAWHAQDAHYQPIIKRLEEENDRKITSDIRYKLIKMRDAFIAEDYEEAYHQLYGIADPEFTCFKPWTILEDNKFTADLASKEQRISELEKALDKVLPYCEILLRRLRATNDEKALYLTNHIEAAKSALNPTQKLEERG